MILFYFSFSLIFGLLTRGAWVNQVMVEMITTSKFAQTGRRWTY